MRCVLSRGWTWEIDLSVSRVIGLISNGGQVCGGNSRCTRSSLLPCLFFRSGDFDGDLEDFRLGFRFLAPPCSPPCEDTELSRALGPPSNVQAWFSDVHLEQGMLLSHWRSAESDGRVFQRTLTFLILTSQSMTSSRVLHWTHLHRSHARRYLTRLESG